MLRRLGRYEVGACIGRGGMADVYRAHDPSIGRAIAIKVLKGELRRNPHLAARFLREARAAGALSHPNIVTIHDVGEEDGVPYIAMEYLDGETLDQVVARGKGLEPGAAIEIGIRLAEALAYAHACKVVHRDVKPSNIMLGPDRRSIKLLDFGIAGVERADASETLKTQAGQVLGTPRYMSPEQALGREADGRSDLFSVGVVLYELLAGRRAFDGANPGVVAMQIVSGDPDPLSKVAPRTPRGLQFIIAKLMMKAPQKRFGDGVALTRALRREQAAEQSRKSAGRALPLPYRTALALGLITAAVLCICAVAVLEGEDAAMQRMAVASGGAIASFVASNAAVTAADSASSPGADADWLPVQAFVRAAAADPSVKAITVVDADGVVRASSHAGVGRFYAPPAGEALITREGPLVVTESGSDALRFVRPITYAGRTFGRVDVSLDRSGLEAASELSRALVALLALVTLGAVIAASFAAARSIAGPLRRLKDAMADATDGDFDFRLSHRRRDEVGELFDGFNSLVSAVHDRLEAPPPPLAAADAPSVPATLPVTEHTHISPPRAPLDETLVVERLPYVRAPAAGARKFGLRRA